MKDMKLLKSKNKNTALILRLFAAAVFFASSSAFAWGTTGHRVIAEIAENNMDHSSKAELRKLIGKQKLAYWANWPDFIKSDTTGVWKQADVWHYINIPPQKNLVDFKLALTQQAGPNLYTQIKVLKEQLKNRKTPYADRNIALRFLIHLVGDLHQPLHTGRAEDLGGNKIRLTYFGDKTNLHSLWDSKIVESQGYSYTEFARVLDTLNSTQKKKVQLGNLEEWFFDSHQIANTVYAKTPGDKNYSYDYNYLFTATLERQLLYGGLRLAKVLNEVL